MAHSTAQNAIGSYLGSMQPLHKEDVFTGTDITGTDTRTLENHLWMLLSETRFDTPRGFLMASALSLPLWSVVLWLLW